MPTGWQTFPVEFQGGLVTNISPLQQGINQPGSARKLVNFEPSIEGGYRRIEGYTKFSTSFVPPYGDIRLQGTQGSVFIFNVANVFQQPVNGSRFSFEGRTTVYTVVSSVFDSANKTAVITTNNPATVEVVPGDNTKLIFQNNANLLIEGLTYHDDHVVVYRGADLWKSSGTTWTKINAPSYGTVLVNGAGQTGSTLAVDGLTGVPQIGDTFRVNGIAKTYTVLAVPTVTSGGATLSISPALDSSPADNAAINFLSTDRSSGGKHRFITHDFTGTEVLVGVDSNNYPFKYDGSTFTVIRGTTDILAAEHVVEFKNHLFYAKGNLLVFSAPFTDDNFSVADGAGVINFPTPITGLIVFREQLIVFSTSKIHRLTGNTISDFQLQPITLDIGCVKEDSIQEVGGDIAFIGPDGIRLLSATDRVGDFGLAVASRPIQSEVKVFTRANTSFTSCTIREKNQYRVFGYSAVRNSAYGVLGVQFVDQTAQGMAWAELSGIRAYLAHSVYTINNGEIAVFSNEDGFVYRMESGNSFDGAPISSSFYTPFFSFGDPTIRKTYYKLNTYLDPLGSVSGTATLKLDLDELGVLQPDSDTFSNVTSPPNFYGFATYGTATYGTRPRKVFENVLVGAGFTASIEYNFIDTNPPFSLDAITIEFLPNDRQ